MVTAVSKELTVCMFDLHLQDIRRWSQQVRSNTAIFLPEYIQSYTPRQTIVFTINVQA
jgi:hypothetical protein